MIHYGGGGGVHEACYYLLLLLPAVGSVREKAAHIKDSLKSVYETGMKDIKERFFSSYTGQAGAAGAGEGGAGGGGGRGGGGRDGAWSGGRMKAGAVATVGAGRGQ